MRMVTAASLAALLALAGTAAAQSIASTDGEMPGVKLDVTELKVGNGVVMLKFTVTNDSEKPLSSNTMYDPNGGEAHDVGGIYLVDAQNKKKYLAIKDAANHCLCSRSLEDFAPKSRTNLWARFAAPAEGVQKIGVVVPHFIPLDDVPISR